MSEPSPTDAALPGTALPEAAVRTPVVYIWGRLEEALAADDRSEETWAALVAVMKAVPRFNRGPRWRATLAAVHAHFRRKPSAAFDHLRAASAGFARQGRPEMFVEFWERMQPHLHPLTLNAHGYHVALHAQDPDALWRGLAEVVDSLRSLGHACLVTSGTLLGLHRDGGPVRHDDDLDLAVLLAARTAAEAARAWTELRLELGADGLLDEEFDARGHVHTKLVHPGGALLDLFPAWVEDDRAWVWPYCAGDVASTDLLPLREVRHGDVVLDLPAHPEALLEVNYGPGWRTPDPTWRFDWDAAKPRFGAFLTALQAERAARSLLLTDTPSGLGADGDPEDGDEDADGSPDGGSAGDGAP